MTNEQHIENLKKLLEQEPCDDAISRQAAIDEIRTCRFVVDAIEKIRGLPSVTPQQKMGWWIEERNDYGEIINWHCSNCYDDSGFITTCKWDYCPNCGAKMQEVEE